MTDGFMLPAHTSSRLKLLLCSVMPSGVSWPPQKCSCCWQVQPPYHWERKHAPKIPSTKENLVMALGERALVDLPPNTCLRDLTTPELKYLFRKHVRGDRHPSDPLHGLSSCSKSDLVQRVKTHGLDVDPKATKGCMMSTLRHHWQEQCALAGWKHDLTPECPTEHPLTPECPTERPTEPGWDLVIYSESELEHTEDC